MSETSLKGAKTPFLLAAFLGALLAGCSSVSTTVDYDRNTDFGRYRTYSWREGHRANPISDRRIKDAVDRVLASRGLTRVEGDGDLTVVYHGRTSRHVVVDSWGPGWGYGWRWRGPGYTTVREIPVGTLIVDLVDAREKELVWRGTASRAIEVDATPAEKAEDLNESVVKMFEGYPPRG
jgi:hypothetical protein